MGCGWLSEYGQYGPYGGVSEALTRLGQMSSILCRVRVGARVDVTVRANAGLGLAGRPTANVSRELLCRRLGLKGLFALHELFSARTGASIHVTINIRVRISVGFGVQIRVHVEVKVKVSVQVP